MGKRDAEHEESSRAGGQEARGQAGPERAHGESGYAEGDGRLVLISAKALGDLGEAVGGRVLNSEFQTLEGKPPAVRMHGDDLLALYRMARIAMAPKKNGEEFRPSPRYAASMKAVRDALQQIGLLPT